GAAGSALGREGHVDLELAPGAIDAQGHLVADAAIVERQVKRGDAVDLSIVDGDDDGANGGRGGHPARGRQPAARVYLTESGSAMPGTTTPFMSTPTKWVAGALSTTASILAR